MRGSDVIIVGGGVAGLSAALALGRRGARVLLLERDGHLANHASGNNAAIFRPLEHDLASAVWPRRSRQLLVDWFGPSLLEETGLLLVSDDAVSVRALAELAVEARVEHEQLSRQPLWELAPSLRAGEAACGLWLRGGGVLDVPALTRGLAGLARAAGAELRCGAPVRNLSQLSGRISGVVLPDGSRLEAAQVIVAGGAWSDQLAREAGLGLPLRPLRRHLIELQAQPEARLEPVVWRITDEVYYRGDRTQLLASPCDETECAPDMLVSDPRALPSLRDKLRRLAPGLATASALRVWACLRTFARDRELVLGEDPRLAGLYWFTGLGGRGMSVAPAAAVSLAATLAGERDALPPSVSPARLL